MGILTGCLSPCQTDWLPNYWGLVLLCGEIINTGKRNKRLMGRGCQLVCVFVCRCVCVSVWWLHSCINTVLSVDESVGQAWPSSSVICLCRAHTQEIKKPTYTHTNMGLGVKWCLEGVNLGSGWREAREGQITLLLAALCVWNGCFCWQILPF